MKATKRREVVAQVTEAGYVSIRCAGSHEIFKHSLTNAIVCIPTHKEIAPGTLRDINKTIVKNKQAA